MCGISGYVGAQPSDGIDLRASLATIRHRGPDERGLHESFGAALGMARLAVIDLSMGHQPIYNEDGSVVVVFNGEIYNYRELRAVLIANGHKFVSDGDTEVLVHLYEEHKEGMLPLLQGMFAFAIYDIRDRSLFLARDRFGKKPLYYQRLEDGFAFSSELKGLRPLVRSHGVSWSVNHQAVSHYLSLGVVPQPLTIFKDVYAVPAGSWLRVRPPEFQMATYWSTQFTPKLDITFAEAVEETQRLVGESVRLRLRSDVPLGVFLSGGLDSSVIAYEAAQTVGGDLPAFTVSTGAGLDESEIARDTAARLGIQHHVLPLKLDPVEGLEQVVAHYDQPFADPSAIPSLQIAKLARAHVTVVLNGDGGDEVFAGYRRHVAALQYGRARAIPRVVPRGVAGLLGAYSPNRRSKVGLAARFARGLALSPEERYLAWSSDMFRDADKRVHWKGEAVEPTENLIALTERANLGRLDQQMATDIDVNLLSDLLVKMDMACMAHSLEARSPFLDHTVAEFAWRLPDGFKVRRGIGKYVLREAYRSSLSDSVIGGAKRGFEIPLRQWLASDLKDQVYDTLGSASARVLDYLDSDVVTDVLNPDKFADRNRPYLVYALLVLELWLVQEGMGACPTANGGADSDFPSFTRPMYDGLDIGQ